LGLLYFYSRTAAVKMPPKRKTQPKRATKKRQRQSDTSENTGDTSDDIPVSVTNPPPTGAGLVSPPVEQASPSSQTSTAPTPNPPLPSTTVAASAFLQGSYPGIFNPYPSGFYPPLSALPTGNTSSIPLITPPTPSPGVSSVGLTPPISSSTITVSGSSCAAFSQAPSNPPLSSGISAGTASQGLYNQSQLVGQGGLPFPLGSPQTGPPLPQPTPMVGTFPTPPFVAPGGSLSGFNSISIGGASSVPIDFHVSAKVKQQIWANEYIDLSVLLNKTSIATPEYKYALDLKGSTPTISAVPQKAQLKVSTILQWVEAFEIFIAVYIQRFPAATATLLKHSQVVRELSSLGGDWKHYDEQFRLIRQCKPVPWDEVNTTLWSKALIRRPYDRQFPRVQDLASTNQRAQPKNKVGRGQNHPRGACFRYHGGATCTVNNCTFDHKCYHCGQLHPAISCPSSFRKQQQRQQSKSANASQSRKAP